MEDSFPLGEDGLEMTQADYTNYALYFCYYYIAIYKEIITQFAIRQNQWES